MENDALKRDPRDDSVESQDSADAPKKPKGRRTFPVDSAFGSAFIGGPPLQRRAEVERWYQDPSAADQAAAEFEAKWRRRMDDDAVTALARGTPEAEVVEQFGDSTLDAQQLQDWVQRLRRRMADAVDTSPASE